MTDIREIQFLINFFLIIIYLIISAFYLKFYESILFLKIIITYSFFVLFYILYSSKKLSKVLINPYSIFLVLTYIFHFGQLLVWLIRANSVTKSFYLFRHSSITEIIFSSLLSLGVILFFNLGGILSHFSKKDIKETNEKEFFLMRESSKKLIIILFILGLIPKIVYDYGMITAALKGGYTLARHAPVTHGLWDDFSQFFNLGIFFTIITYKNYKKTINVLTIFVIIYSIFKMYITGSRGPEVLFIVSLLWLYNSIISPLKNNRAKSYLLWGLLVLPFINIIPNIRKNITKDYNLFNLILNSFEGNLIFDQLKEFGNTLYTVVLSFRYVPNTTNYLKGSSYVVALLTIFPNIGGVILRLSESHTPNYILNNYIEGIGGSYIAELYFNFGIFGLIFSIIIGFFVGMFSNRAIKNILEGNIPYIAFSGMFLSIILWTVRDSFIAIPRATVLYIFIPLIIWKFIYNYEKRKFMYGK